MKRSLTEIRLPDVRTVTVCAPKGWLDDIGLPQYKDQFNEGRVDGYMLQYLTVVSSSCAVKVRKQQLGFKLNQGSWNSRYRKSGSILNFIFYFFQKYLDLKHFKLLVD